MTNKITESDSSFAPFDASRLKARWAADMAARRALSARLLAEISERARPVLDRFGAREAVVFGSLVEGRAHEDWDVDLVVLGTDAGAYWDLRHALEEAVGRPLDLFTETDDARFVAKARARGVVIYECQS
jgi:predicted nucleotidyltransferase